MAQALKMVLALGLKIALALTMALALMLTLAGAGNGKGNGNGNDAGLALAWCWRWQAVAPKTAADVVVLTSATWRKHFGIGKCFRAALEVLRCNKMATFLDE